MAAPTVAAAAVAGVARAGGAFMEVVSPSSAGSGTASLIVPVLGALHSLDECALLYARLEAVNSGAMGAGVDSSVLTELFAAISTPTIPQLSSEAKEAALAEAASAA